MSKIFRFNCPKHGDMTIEVQKPPIVQHSAFCPWCATTLAGIPADKKKFQPNYVSEGAQP